MIGFQKSSGRIFVIFGHDGHWTLLAGMLQDGLRWTHHDGLPSPAPRFFRIATMIAETITDCLGGAIALLNMAYRLQIQHEVPANEEEQLHDFFLRQKGMHPNFTALGKGPDQLAQLLISKGVTEQHVQARHRWSLTRLDKVKYNKP